MTSIVSHVPSEPEFDDGVRPQRSKLVHRMRVFLERLIARSRYATPNDLSELAELLESLIDDEDRRSSMGATGRARAEIQLAWHHQVAHYTMVYGGLISSRDRSQSSLAAKGA